MTDVLIDARRGAGSSLEILYGTVTWKPTLTHSRGSSIVLPAPTTYDLVDGQVVATNVQPTPEPVAGQIEWAYEVTFKDRHSKSYSFLVGVPDSTTQVNFISLPRYFETKPPLFGQGEQGVPGDAATVAVGTVADGAEASVTNSGTNTDAVLNFVLPEGPQGPPGEGVNSLSNKAFADAPSTYPTGVSQSYISSSSLGWPLLNSLIVTDKRVTGRTVQTITGMDDNIHMRRTEIAGDLWSAFKEVADTDLATTSDAGLMSSADKLLLNSVETKISDSTSIPSNTKYPIDNASTYPNGVSVTTGRTADGWPTVRGSHILFTRITTEKPRSLDSAIQYATAYITVNAGSYTDNEILYRVSDSYGDWGTWQTIQNDSATMALVQDVLNTALSSTVNVDEIHHTVFLDSYGGVSKGLSNGIATIFYAPYRLRITDLTLNFDAWNISASEIDYTTFTLRRYDPAIPAGNSIVIKHTSTEGITARKPWLFDALFWSPTYSILEKGQTLSLGWANQGTAKVDMPMLVNFGVEPL